MDPVPCQICGDALADTILSEVVGGEKRTQMVCQGCLQNHSLIAPASIAKAMPKIAEVVASLLPGAAAEAFNALTGDSLATSCDICGMTWNEFKQKNSFGCENDYEVFRHRLEGVLNKVQGSNRHRGREPAGLREARDRWQRHQDLRTKLDAAILDEDYERAARLRDAIHSLERGDTSEHPSAF